LDIDIKSPTREREPESILVKVKSVIIEEKRSNWEIDYEELIFGDFLGQGAFAKVYKAKWRNEIVAVKKIILSESNSVEVNQRMTESFRDEAKLMMGLRPHPNLVLLLGVVSDPLCIVQEFVARGGLSNILENDDFIIGVPIVLQWARNISSGMSHLEVEKIVHRDLAARNILISYDWVAKVSDFGFARVSKSAVNVTTQETGPVRWMAPEALFELSYSHKTDVYSYAVTIWEIIAREIPWNGIEINNIVIAVHNNERPQIPAKTPESLKNLITKCWQSNPDDRPTFSQICDILDSITDTEWI